ncbi:TonB-linked outer membrane protein, SusC/RagA family [Pedobacter steynii]|uniref:TonB-linked outer membrane protein, SusC/RagA family n=1 Tax=Pedobacter steynii TaxID=430522 RepID=A0A1G9USC2_9SPHI|nr:SusC/RagA family TonB-linked outer membrane protein [Pedobacter steynii]NQX40859.1 SusC/RagA family TonB-linked outer membrane protein [Pedobacter steynii]SDM62776.1 TonB-linked outer membrane protein, SusC/RagA family [Pedobacter steynii]
MCIKLPLLLCASLCLNFSYGYARDLDQSAFQEPLTDTSKLDTTRKIIRPVVRRKGSISPQKLSEIPVVSLQQYLKGQAPGLTVQEPSGEPGTIQNMFIRGLSGPLLSPADVMQQQPLVVLDGIPLIGEHPFAYDIQLYNYNRIGTATNLLTNIDMNNIQEVKVLRDLSAVAIYGPNAANGVILLTSKKPGTIRRISFNTYFGLALRPNVTTLNASAENAFRKQFYDRYTANGRYSDEDVYPQYLSDASSPLYNGPSNWTDYYYRNGMVHGISADLSGGTERANFRFAGGNVRNEGVADSTGLNRYNVMFNINMKPLQWLTVSLMVNANRLERDRNRSLRDRFAQTNYIPSLSLPLAPNKEVYGKYLNQFSKGYDNNINTLLDGYGKLIVNLKDVEISSGISVDYNEGTRDIFFAKPLMEGNSYASNYFGYNQRLLFENVISYTKQFGSDHHLKASAGQLLQWDLSKYNYAYAYKGVNDFIKLNLINKDLIPTSFPANLLFKFLDKTSHNLLSVYGRATYDFKDKYSLSLLLREDASSNAQPTSRWFLSSVLSAGWNVKNDLLSNSKNVSALSLRLSAGRLGKTNAYDNFGQGPQYTSDIGYTGNVTLPGYNGFAILSRPYNFGWVGYGIPWAYTDQLNFGIDFGINNNRLQGSLDVYTKTDKNQLLGIPAYSEYGYKTSLEPGLSVNNKGVELLLSYAAVQSQNNGFAWTPAFNISYNANKLVALPGGLKEIVIGNRLLRTGEAVDRYWLLTNEGIYNSVDELRQADGTAMQYSGTALQPGDPKWKDQNGDQMIDARDKTLYGHSQPVVIGGFNNDFKYGKWSLSMNFYFNLGHSLMNQQMANSLDFINREGGNSITSLKEITFWEKRGNRNDYPLYNPWSSVIPYRIDQNLFLENASFLKMRTLSVGYDLVSAQNRGKLKINGLYVYAMASNLFTLTKYKGTDPELVPYTGYDTGYGMPIPRTYTLGLKMNL